MSTDVLEHSVDLGGTYTHPHWLAFLCGGLSAAGVSVVSGRAVRLEGMDWEGHLLVTGPVSARDAAALASTRPVTRDPGRLQLTSYTVERRADGQLSMQVEAPDELGFLGRLLSRVSLLTLVPTALEIATVTGHIRDTVVLGGIGHSQPSEDVRVALEDLLSRARS
ncbi:MAG: hypothetical protein JWM40_68 [Frankiales bacterium]|nr:hypothetical protein [Frankiales bacterium]